MSSCASAMFDGLLDPSLIRFSKPTKQQPSNSSNNESINSNYFTFVVSLGTYENLLRPFLIFFTSQDILNLTIYPHRHHYCVSIKT